MYNANSEEQKILEFWEKDKTFEKSLKKTELLNRKESLYKL